MVSRRSGAREKMAPLSQSEEGRAEQLSKGQGTQQEGLSHPQGRCDMLRAPLLTRSHCSNCTGPMKHLEIGQNVASDSAGVFALSDRHHETP